MEVARARFSPAAFKRILLHRFNITEHLPSLATCSAADLSNMKKKSSASALLTKTALTMEPEELSPSSVNLYTPEVIPTSRRHHNTPCTTNTLKMCDPIGVHAC